MAQKRQASELVICDGVPIANYRGISRLLWYIYDRKVSRVDAGRLIHEYAVAWADARDKFSRSDAPVSGTQPTLKGEAQSASQIDVAPC
jgi:hypothetical protein